MMLLSFLLGTIGLIGFAISSLQERKHPHKPSRDNTFAMTTDKYSFAAKLQAPIPQVQHVDDQAST
jgi:hypothetical protein